MPATEQQQKTLKARVVVMLYNLLGCVPESQEINSAFMLIRVMSKSGYSLQLEHSPYIYVLPLSIP